MVNNIYDYAESQIVMFNLVVFIFSKKHSYEYMARIFEKPNNCSGQKVNERCCQ